MFKVLGMTGAAFAAAMAIMASPVQAQGRGYDRDYSERRYHDRQDARRAYRNDGRFQEGRRTRCRSNGAGGTILGAIVGGLLGDAAVGRRGDGTAGAIAGAGAGALAGRAIQRSGRRC